MYSYFRNIQIKSVVLLNCRRIQHCCNHIQQSNHSVTRKRLLPNLTSVCDFKRFSIFNKQTYNLRSVNKLFISQQLSNDGDTNESKIRNDSKVVEFISSQFRQPKNILHNFYDVVAQEVMSKEYKVNPTYKMHSLSNSKKSPLCWSCTYHVKWPEENNFQATANTKKEASHRAACKTLAYLLKTGKINAQGVPLLYDKSTTKQITQEVGYTIKLTLDEQTQLKNIYNLFEEKILPEIDINEIKDNNNFISHNSNFSDDELLDAEMPEPRISKQKITNLYDAKEIYQLPIRDHKKDFMDLLDTNRVILVRGEPGCGKSTRVPQYVLEHFVRTTQSTDARIIVTEPRRIAAVSLAETVCHERNEQVGRIVGYQIRLNNMFNPRTGKILYCTNGILLNRIQNDPDLTNVTHIILDEVHERDLNTDLLMNLIRNAMTRNKNLKLILMSATINTKLFQDYFENPAVMNIPGFTYPVKMHFLEDISLDLSKTELAWNNYNRTTVVYEDVAKVIKWINKTKPDGAILCFLPGWEEMIKVKQLLLNSFSPNTTYVVTIHSKLLYEEQRKIFRKPPPGIRKIILATNIAETSITVDDVVYVVDAGIHKETRFDPERGIMCIDNHRISQSSVNQRKGRAGRVQPGESFHIYSKTSYNEMLPYSIPEILRTSLTKVVLDAKVYSPNLSSEEFFSLLPTPPKDETVRKAVEELQDLEMLDENENLTPLGRVASDFQLPPKLTKAMIHSVIYKCVIPIVDIVTLSSYDSEIFTGTLTNKDEINKTKSNLCKNSDHIALVILFEKWNNLMMNNELLDASMYCSKYNLASQKMNNIKQLKDIHYDYLATYLKNILPLSDDFAVNKEFIKGVLLSGVGTVLFKRNWDKKKGRITKKKVFITRNNTKATITSESVNYKRGEYESPFLVYINETRSEMRRTSLIRDTSVIQPLTFLLFKNSNLYFEKVENNSTEFEDAVIVKLDGMHFKILCDRHDAELIHKCKYTLKTMENYFIYQLTKGGQENKTVLMHWHTILQMLNTIIRS